MSASASLARLRELLAPVVAAAGYDLEDVTVTPAGRRRLVRVVVDRDGGVALDDVAEVSSAVSAALDETEPLGGAPYVLEVTSPGVDRPVRTVAHWRRATGRLVKVTVAGAGPLTGRVVVVDDDGVTFDVHGTEQRHRLADLGPGAVQVEFARAGAATAEGEEDAE